LALCLLVHNCYGFRQGYQAAQLALHDETIAPFELDLCNLVVSDVVYFKQVIVMPRLKMRRSKLMRGGSGEVEISEDVVKDGIGIMDR